MAARYRTIARERIRQSIAAQASEALVVIPQDDTITTTRKGNNNNSEPYNNCWCRQGCPHLFSLCLLISMIGLVIIVGLSVGFSKKNQRQSSLDTPSSSSDGIPTSSPTSTLDGLLNVLENRVISLSGDKVLLNVSSPQFQAYHWLLQQDTQILKLEHNDNSSSINLLMDRYVLAVVYFSTDGPNWASRSDFLTMLPVCNWTIQGDNDSSLTVLGIECNHLGEVEKLFLSTCDS